MNRAALAAVAIAMSASAASADGLTPEGERVVRLATDAYVAGSGCNLGFELDWRRQEFLMRAAGYDQHWLDASLAVEGDEAEVRRRVDEAQAADPVGRYELELERQFDEFGLDRVCADAAERVAAAGATEILLRRLPPDERSTFGQADARCDEAVRFLLASPDRYRRTLPPGIEEAGSVEMLGVVMPSRVVSMSFLAAGADQPFLSPHVAACRFAWPVDPDRPRVDGRPATAEEIATEEVRLADRSAPLRALPRLSFAAPLLWSVEIDGKPVRADVFAAIRLAEDVP